MRTGHDEHGLVGKGRSRISGFAGIVMVSGGVLLLLGVAFYYALGFYSTTNLDDLNASIDGSLSLPSDDSLFVSAAPGKPEASGEIILQDNSVLHGALLADGSFKTVGVVKDISSFTPIETPNDTAAVNTVSKLDIAQTVNSESTGNAQVISPERLAQLHCMF